jgi:aquaporin Z
MSSLTEPKQFSPAAALRLHWPEFLIEAWALGVFMLCAAVVSTELRQVGSPWQSALTGMAMGGTAVALIYSRWGARSGAHMNPAVTLAFLSLGRISPVNAAGYIVSQFIGGYLGVLLAWISLGPAFAQPPVRYIVTQPGAWGSSAAFAAEFSMSLVLMLTILWVSNEKRWSGYTGWLAGLLIAVYVSVESPLSGMSLNPARTVASALPAQDWTSAWLYFVAPITGMWLAARLFHVLIPWVERTHHSAKIVPHNA